MTKLLICGSRDASPKMIDMAYTAVHRAKSNGWSIVVGDAQGIDCAVVNACVRYNIPCHVYGIAPKPRYIDLEEIAVVFPTWQREYTQVRGNYLNRDRVMVEAADAVFAIWNGTSHGTIYTYNYAVKCGKQAWLRTFKGKQT